MATYTSSLGASLERAYHHWRERGALLERPPEGETTKPMTVAVSREYGAGGSAVAKALADRLDWPLYDRELLEKIAEDTGIQSRLLEELDEKRPNWFADCLEGFSQERHISGVGFAIHMKRILMALYCHGNCVIVGRGATQVLPADHSLFVRLIAPLPIRIDRIAERMRISQPDAKNRIAEIDVGRAEFVRSYFHMDVADPCGYDILINTAKFSQIACVELIVSALERRRAID